MSAVNQLAFFERIGYVPHGPGQWSFHRSKNRFRVPVCGRRFGKSTMAGRDLEPQLFIREKAMHWIVGPTYDLGEKEFRVVWDDLIIGQELGRDKRLKKAYNKRTGDMYIEMPWGTRLEVRSAQHPETLVGERLKSAIMSEAAKHRKETWERFIRPALADERGGATFPTTPEGHNWLYDLWLYGQNPDVEGYESWQFPSWDNRIVYPGGRQDEEILLLEQTTSPEFFLQEIGADFASFVGRIYAEFEETSHIRKHVYNPNWPNYIAFDWGFTNPLAAIEFQVDPQDNIYVWREHYRAYTTLEEHLEIMKEREQPPGYQINLTFGDAADPEAALVVTQKLAPCIAMPEAKTNWRQGVNRVKFFLKPRQIGEMDEYGTPLEAPKLFVDHSCKNTIREFINYRAADNTSARNAREIAQGVDDHAMNALRYGLVHLYELGVNHHLADVALANAGLVSAGSNVTPFSIPNDSGIFTWGKEF